MTKEFEDVVSSEKDERKGSVFSTWTYKDYLRLWVNSIKSFGGSDATVLLVATHAEGKTKDPKTKLSKTGPLYPFSKTTFQRDVMTSQLKAEVSRSVGMIYIDGHPAGTGFRVGDRYIMTCLHVIQSIITEHRKLTDHSRIFIQFERKLYLQDREEKNSFNFERSVHYVHDGFDVALLELKKHHLSDVGFPPALSSFSTIQQFPSEVHLIGHPGGVQMKEDSEVYPGIIEPNNDVDKYIEDLSQWSVGYFPDGVDYYRELRDPPRKILFHSAFNQGSSGSPGVILRQQRPSVVLIVRGGAPSCFYENKFSNLSIEDNKKVEYGYAMEDIHQDMRTSQSESIRKLASEIFKEWI
ncbi:serine protease FAM111B-like [Saccostrea cucullata]|uniref:serine protease FAM111B-like n=1 Tax=Saccostrea cuccullata TaxID=36930 RepID=UPI002ED6305C